MNSVLTIKIAGQQEIESKIHALENALDTRRILDEGAALLFNRMRSRFLVETDPSGQKWPPSKAALHRAKIGRGGGTLFDTGKLFRSLQLYADSENSRAIGTNVTSKKGFPYPMMHQYGLGKFPQRQFLGFGDEDVSLMTRLILRRLTEGLK